MAIGLMIAALTSTGLAYTHTLTPTRHEDGHAWGVLAQSMTPLPPLRAASAMAFSVTTPPFPLDQTFKLHSVPGAARVVYLDFHGATIANTAWNGYNNNAAFVATPFDTDNSPVTFSSSESAVVQSVWQRVAEDYSPLAVDVTTEDPGIEAINRTDANDMYFGTRALITNGSVLGDQCNCGGVSYVGAFDALPTHQALQPSFVYAKALGGDDKNIGEAVSHEVGHALGLSHDGNASTGYYGGQGPWAPIMGLSYYEPLTQFSKGDYANANNTEDDYAVMVSHGAPLVTDDRGDTAGTAYSLGSGPTYSSKGIIGTDADVDMYSFTAPAGDVSFTASPAPRGPDLDVKAELLDASGAVLDTDDPPATHPNTGDPNSVGGIAATVSADVSGGTYFLRLQGVGIGDPKATGYSGYGSVGSYTLSGTTGAATPPTVSMRDATVNEGNAGTTNVTFTIGLSVAAPLPITLAVATVGGSASPGSDFSAASGTVTIPAGATSATYTVAALGDTTPEANETFSLAGSNVVGALLGNMTGHATLMNDDGVTARISDVSKYEGAGSTTTSYAFTVTLNAASMDTVSVVAFTADYSAVAPGDYTAKTATLTFAPGEVKKTFTVTVKGDRLHEPNETFAARLKTPSAGLTIADAVGVGTIKNDD